MRFLEVCPRVVDVPRIFAWLLRPDRKRIVVRPRDRELVYRGAAANPPSVLIEEVESSDFVRIGLATAPGPPPFASDLEMARAAHDALGVEVRCSPGPTCVRRSGLEWWSVSGNGERLIEWWTPQRFADLCSFRLPFNAVGTTNAREVRTKLVKRYAEPHRAYHKLLHLSEAHGVCVESQARAERPHEIEVALWFHDAIYDTRRHDNEERSADWAREELLAGGAAADVADRVHALVLATKHRDPPETNDAQLLVDADLSILAAPPDRFAIYERQIRQEYDWVPEPQFREAREKFLRGMLARPSIFSDAAMRERHEAHARRNIEDSLRRLGTAEA